MLLQILGIILLGLCGGIQHQLDELSVKHQFSKSLATAVYSTRPFFLLVDSFTFQLCILVFNHAHIPILLLEKFNCLRHVAPYSPQNKCSYFRFELHIQM